MIIDLHLHSTYSDGGLTPEQIIDETYKMLEKELLENENETIAIISITDHDTTKHIRPALDYAYKRIKEENETGRGLKVYVVPGVEISTTKEHIVTYFNPYYAKWEDEEYQKIIEKTNEFREDKFDANCEILNERYPYLDLNPSQIKEEWGGTLGKPALADAISEKLEQLNLCLDYEEKFVCDLTTIYYDYLNDLPKKDYPIKPEDLIKTVHDIGGICILAHPKENMPNDDLLEYLNMGINGIERPKSIHRKDEYVEFLSSLGLISTYGSDCHFQEKDKNPDYKDYAFGFPLEDEYGVSTDETIETFAGGAFSYLKDFENIYVPTVKYFKK